MSGNRRAVFLDRDGVLNAVEIRGGKPYPPSGPAQLRINPEAVSGLPALREAGFLLIVATNQPDVGRGTQTRETVENIHGLLRAALPLDAFYVCYHGGKEGCECRKPKPGMLLQAAAEMDVDLARSFMIGDRWRDIEAGASAGCRTVFLDFGYAERSPDPPATKTVASLAEAVAWILHPLTRGVPGHPL